MMIQNKFMQIIDKDNRLWILFGGMLIDVLLLIALVVYTGLLLTH